MTNCGPAEEGQRRTGDEPRRRPPSGDLVRTATQRGRIIRRAQRSSTSSPIAVTWIVLQLCLVVLLLALWKGRRMGPLVAEQLPVVVRASETVEGRGRLYRSRRARDRAADALRTATLQRLLPRLGLGPNAEPRIDRPDRRAAHRPGSERRRPYAVRSATGDRRRPGQPCPRARRHRKAGRTVVTQPVAQTTSITRCDAARNALLALRTEIAKVVVGQDAVVSGLVIALLCRGHVLLEGVPGVAKTLLVRTLAAALQLEFKRVQFTPDLMPGDVTGSLVYDARTAEFEFHAGPGVHQSAAGRRDQPDTAEDAGRAARGDGGTTGQRRRRAAGRCPTRSSSPPRRTRSSTRAPTSCPRRSSTASC